MACRLMTSRVFLLSTPRLDSRFFHAASIAEPLTPTVKLLKGAEERGYGKERTGRSVDTEEGRTSCQ